MISDDIEPTDAQKLEIRNRILSAFSEIKNIFHWCNGDPFKGIVDNMGWAYCFEELTKSLVTEGYTVERWWKIHLWSGTPIHVEHEWMLCQLPKLLEEYKRYPRKNKKDDRADKRLLMEIALWMKMVKQKKRAKEL